MNASLTENFQLCLVRTTNCIELNLDILILNWILPLKCDTEHKCKGQYSYIPLQMTYFLF